ncbi:MAG: thioredoxin fold domain-containing protein, partial [Bacteroidota bacterium]|nr:thioredoxin fold domain-containing protein [Bacteroidota bacterium]
MKKLFFALLLFPFLSFAQKEADGKGMKFEHGLSWKEIKAKAKAENKYIFMDCFTTWCGPCKYMSANIFPMAEVGEFFNKNYLMVKVQFDTTKNDNEEVKSWFPDMEAINAAYKIQAYPTYLFFDPSGTAVHRAVGSSDAKTFLAKGADAMQPEKQYYTLLHKYEKGEKSPEFLRTLASVAFDAYDMPNAKKISTEYIATQTDLLTRENLTFLDKFTQKSTDKGFDLFLNNTEKVDAVLGKDKAEQKIMGILTVENVYPVILKRSTPENPAPIPDFDALSASLQTKYPKYGEELVAKGKVIYYQYKKDWNGFQSAVVAFMNKYGEKASPAELNSYAWTVFDNCKDMTCVTEALDWSKRSFKDKEEPMYIDTYANILHKLGRTQEAIQWEEKAVALAGAGDKKTY